VRGLASQKDSARAQESQLEQPRALSERVLLLVQPSWLASQWAAEEDRGELLVQVMME
jgi:hypothetical protein